MSTLYELNNEWTQLQSMAQDPDIDSEVLADTMEGLEYEIECKAENIAKIIKNIMGDINAIGEEIARLTAKKKSLEKKIDSLKRYLTDSMILTDKRKFKTALFSFSIQKNPKKVVIDPDVDIKKVPVRFRVIVQPTIDKVALKAELEEGKTFKWAHLEQTEGLRIR